MDQGYHLLAQYENRQVIINYFEEDGMIDRKGFFFDTIQITDGQVQFLKDEQVIYTLPCVAPLIKLTGFSHHYSQGEGERRVEMYFPY